MLKEITVEELYSKDTSLKKDDILELLEWVSEQENLPNIGEKRTILFYQSCRYNKEVAKSAIRHYFDMAKSIPEFFKNTNPINNEKLKLAINEAIKGVLPSTTAEGYKVLLMRHISVEAKTFSLEEHIKLLNMVNILMINKHGMPPGLIVILDLKDAPLGCYHRCSIWTIKKAVSFVLKAVPVHLISFHIINAPSLVNRFLAFVKFFAPEAAAKYLQVHSSIESLFKFVPKDIMPRDYGGNAESILELHENNVKELMENTALFLREEELVYGNN